jgi:predicted nucleic acid-binding protein
VKVLLGTDIVIEILRARNPVYLSQWNQLPESNPTVLISPVTVAEVWAGARPKEQESISAFFHPLLLVPIDHEAGRLAGEFLRRFSKSHSLDIADALIAATAVLYQAPLWTRNRKHYPMPEITFLP